MTWTDVENALHAALVTATGLAGARVCFAHGGGPAPSTAPYVRVEFVSAETVGSVDTLKDAPSPVVVGAEVLSTSWTNYRLGVRVHVFGAGAHALALAIAGDLQHPDTIAQLDALGVSVTDSRVAHLPALFESSFQDRAVVDATAFVWLDRTRAQTFIEHVTGVATYSSPGHAPVVIPFGPVP